MYNLICFQILDASRNDAILLAAKICDELIDFRYRIIKSEEDYEIMKGPEELARELRVSLTTLITQGFTFLIGDSITEAQRIIEVKNVMKIVEAELNYNNNAFKNHNHHGHNDHNDHNDDGIHKLATVNSDKVRTQIVGHILFSLVWDYCNGLISFYELEENRYKAFGSIPILF